MFFDHCEFNFVFIGGSFVPIALVALTATGAVPFTPWLLVPMVPAAINLIHNLVHRRLGRRRLADWERHGYEQELGYAPMYAPPINGFTLESDDFLLPAPKERRK